MLYKLAEVCLNNNLLTLVASWYSLTMSWMPLNFSCFASLISWNSTDSEVVTLAPACLIPYHYCASVLVTRNILYVQMEQSTYRQGNFDLRVILGWNTVWEHMNLYVILQQVQSSLKYTDMALRRLLDEHRIQSHPFIHCFNRHTSIPNRMTDLISFFFNDSATSGRYMLNLVFGNTSLASDTSSSDTVVPSPIENTISRWLWVIIHILYGTNPLGIARWHILAYLACERL